MPGLKSLFFRSDDGTETPVDIEIPAAPATQAIPPPAAQASPAPVTLQETDISNHPSFRALQAQLDQSAAREKERDAREQLRMTAEARASAQSWAASLDTERRITPAQVEGFAGLYAQAAEDDRTAPRAAGSPSRVDALKAACKGLPTESERFAAAVANKQILALDPVQRGAAQDAPASAERVDKLLELTPAGQAALAARNGHK